MNVVNRPLPAIIGFCGGMGHGKTTAARMLVSDYTRHGVSFHRLSFADPLRRMLLALGLTIDDLTNPEKKEQPHYILGDRSPRHAMQTLGTEWGRALICDDLWLRCARRRIAEVVATGGSVVFDDVRFDNEASTLRNLGGIVIRVVNTTRPALSPQRSALSHASESGIRPELVDHALTAADTTELRTKLFALLNTYA